MMKQYFWDIFEHTGKIEAYLTYSKYNNNNSFNNKKEEHKLKYEMEKKAK